LFFDGQGPEMVKGLYFRPALYGVEPVFAVKPEPGLVLPVIVEVKPGMGQQEEEEGQAEVIKGENADDTAADEFPVIAGPGLRVQQDARDQKTAHHEEHLHKHPGTDKISGKIVGENDETDADAPPSIEFFYIGAGFVFNV